MKGIYDRIDFVAKALKTEGAVDNVAPAINQIDYTIPVIFPIGTKADEINWSGIITISDNVDGIYEFKREGEKLLLKANPPAAADEEHEFMEGKLFIDTTNVDFENAGCYEEAIVITATDRYNNTAEKKFTVYVYDEDNTLPPVLELKEEIPSLPIDTDTSAVNWAELFTQKAEDVTGIDLSALVSADVTELDVTHEGVYPVIIHVTDFAGNRTETDAFIEIK